MKLEGTGLINIALNNWLKKYGFKARVRGVDTDFYWYYDDTISYSFFFENEAAENWYALFEELGCQYDVELFFTAFLHELGHSCTYWNFEEEEINEHEEMKRLIEEEPSTFADNLHYVYTHLPVEYTATKWAVDYINSYPERVKELVNIVSKTVAIFYKINDVKDN